MKKLLMIAIFVAVFIISVSASEIEAPEAPQSAQRYMPEETESFSEGVLYIVKAAIAEFQPELASAGEICLALIAVTLLTAIIQNFPGGTAKVVDWTGSVVIGLLLLQPSNAMIQLGTETVSELSDYGKLLLPVMTTALAAQGGITSSAALYTGTALFSAILTNLIKKLIVPLIYIFLVVCVANRVLRDEMIGQIKSFAKWLMTWILKIILYVFTGYMGITGVVSGTTDAATLKATKLTISGMVPVVGNIISDASEAVIVGAGVVKNGVGIYGLLAVLSIIIGPFLQIGSQYLMLKMTGAICKVFGSKNTVGLIRDFSVGMGYVLAMTGTVSLLLMISTVCFMKGVS